MRAIIRKLWRLRALHGAIGLGLIAFALVLHAAGAEPAPVPAVALRDGEVVVDAGPRRGAPVVAIASLAGRLELESGDFIEEPDVLPRQAQLRRFYARQGALRRLLLAQDPRLELAGGAMLPLTVRPRGVLGLPPACYAQAIAALLIWFIGAVSFAFSDRGRGARAYLISAGAFAMAAFPAAIYSTRPLALAPSWFQELSRVNVVGTLGFGAAVVELLLVFPKRLSRRVHWLRLLFLVFLALVLSPSLPRAWRSPYNFIAIDVVLILIAAVAQWRATRRDPIARASFGWIVLSVTVGIAFFVVANLLPALLGVPALASQAAGLVGFAAMYFGVCLGVLRWRLFDLDRWWFRTWSWILGGSCVVAIDLLLVAQLDTDGSQALAMSILVTGFAYFPIRQWLLERFQRAPEAASSADDLIGAASFDALDAAFVATVRRHFRPLTIDVDRGLRLSTSAIDELGRELYVPLPRPEEGGLVCRFRDAGQRLFRGSDPAEADAIARIGRAVARALVAREEGEADERQRIRRDLHDDLGASLTHIVQAAADDEQAALGRRAMRDFRNALSALEPGAVEASVLFRSLFREAERRSPDGFSVVWHVGRCDVQLDARQRRHVRAIVREAATNALKHGAGSVRLHAAAMGDRLVFRAESGLRPGARRGARRGGHGLPNIRARAQLLGGDVAIEWRRDAFSLCVRFPAGAIR